MAIQILDGATDITKYIDWRSIDATLCLTKENGTLKFDVLNINSAFVPALGDLMYMKYGGVLMFGGTCTEREVVIDGGLVQRYHITCMDWSYTFNSKLVHKAYANMDPADIVADIVANFAGAGFTTNHVQRGNFLVSSIKFNYEVPTRALESLAKQVGWDWFIDPSKDVHFFFAVTKTGSSEVSPAPFAIDDTSGNINWASLDIDQSIANLKNSIYVIGGTHPRTYGTTDTPDVYTSVAGQMVYTLAYPYDVTTLNVTLNGVAQSVGTDGTTDPGTVNVLYNNGSGGGAQGGAPFIKFTADPGAGYQIKVYGNATLPIVAYMQDPTSVALFGVQPDVIIDKQIKSVLEAQERGEAEIIQFGHATYDVKFDTISPLSYLLYIGQTIMLNSVKLGISNYPLIIKRIEAKGYSPTQLIMSVEALGSDNVTFTDMMMVLLQQNLALNATPDNSILEIILYVLESMTWTETVSISNAGGPYKWGATSPQPRWNFATWG